MRIAILTGGTSSEREVSLASAAQVSGALRSRGHEVAVVDIARGEIPRDEEPEYLQGGVGIAPPPAALFDGRQRAILLGGLGELPAVRNATVLFVALHGGWGEDGTVQAMLEILGQPYTGSGPLASAMAMDKDISKRLYREAQIPTAGWVMAPTNADEVVRKLGWPVVVKPSRQGSTVGLSVVEEAGQLDAAIAHAAEFDSEVMVEQFIPGRELTVGVLDQQALAVGEIIPRHAVFDYHCKYTPGMSEEVFPAPIPEAVTLECQRLALSAHQALKLQGYSRTDFRLTPDGDIFCLETNTLPGLTATSLLPQSAAALGIGFPELCERICKLARRPDGSY